MKGWEEKFEGSSDRALQGARVVAGYAQEYGLQRRDGDDVSVVWGTGNRDVFWCFPDGAGRNGSRRGLELFLRHVPENSADLFRAKLFAFGATQDSDPRLAWGTVVRRWGELRDSVLDRYVETLKES